MKRVGFLLCLWTFILTGCLEDSKTDIKYVVTGNSSSVEIKCLALNNMGQDNTDFLTFTVDSLPWELYYRINSTDHTAYISVVNKSMDSYITVKIIVDNEIVREESVAGFDEKIELDYIIDDN